MALPAAFNTDLLATTIQNWITENGMADNIFKANALFFVLNANKKTKKGGNQIVQPLMYATVGAVGSYSGFDQFDITPSQTLTAAAFDWKQLYGSLSISGREEALNSGIPAFFDILEQRMAGLQMSLQAEADAQMYADGTGNESKDITGLALGIDSAGTYGGIARATHSWWGSQETAAGGVLTEALIRTVYNNCGLGRVGGSPDIGLMTQIIYNAYEDLLTPDKRYSDSVMASAGFENLKYKNAKFMWDEGATTQILWLLNTNFWDLVVMEGRDFTPTGLKVPTNQDARVGQLLWMGNLVQSNCRKSGKLTGVTNT